MIRIQPQNFPGYYFPDGVLSGTIRRTKTFVAASGTAYIAGNTKANKWFQPFTPTIVNNELAMPEIFLAPTIDSDTPDAEYIVEISSKQSVVIPFLVSKFRLPVTSSEEISWNEIKANMRACPPPVFRDAVFTSEQQIATFFRRSELPKLLLDYLIGGGITRENGVEVSIVDGQIVISLTGGTPNPGANELTFGGNTFRFAGNSFIYGN